MKWFVYRDGQVYGPYSKEQLAAFLKPDTLVAPEGSEAWVRAAELPGLADVLDGTVKPKLEWFITPAGKPERGPYAKAAVIAYIEREELKPSDLIRHESWTEPMSLGQSKFFRAYKQGTLGSMDMKELTEGPHAPRIISQEAPAPPWYSSFQNMPRWGIALAIVIVLSPPALYTLWSDYIEPSDWWFTFTHGEPQGNCYDGDPMAMLICRERPWMCRCEEKSRCEYQCQMYQAMTGQGRPKP